LANILPFWVRFKLSSSSLHLLLGQKGFGLNIQSLNTDPDLGFGLVISLNLDLNLGPVQVGSGSNHGSELNIGITITEGVVAIY